MRTQTKERIVDFVAKYGQVTAKSIVEHVGLTPPAVFRHLSKLLSDGIIKKQGTPPKVFYSVNRPSPVQKSYDFAPDAERLIKERFLKITPDGILQTGTQAFIRWCLARKLDPVKTSIEYAASITKFDAHKKDGLIDGMQKMKRAFPYVFLDRLFYLDFYSIERFGKTNLGELILYAKQSQNIALVKLITADVHSRILEIIERFSIDAVGFVPPTVKRNVQFMKELERLLHLPVPTVKITKIRTPIIVPQKTLSKLEERIENARQSLVVEERNAYRNILLIDDAVGTGATINEVANQIRSNKLCTGEIIGLGLTGSFNGFDVIQEA
jgi:DNA-binding transcriptional ArsR family regulator